MGHCPIFTLRMSQHFPNEWANYGARFLGNFTCTATHTPHLAHGNCQ